MIDLHMHTTYSDGTDSVKEILKNANKTKLEVISITDHDTCGSYKEMESFNIKEFYNGSIIVGCEFTTSFDNRIIEVLAYGFDYKKVQDYLNNYYTDDFNKRSKKILCERLFNKIKELSLVCDMKKLEDIRLKSKFFIRDVYEELILSSSNKEILKKDIFSSFSNFCRKGIYNPNSKLFLNYPEFKLSLKEIIELVHNSDGIIFLAHPYQYKFDDTENFLDKIYDENDFDGVECFYTTFSEEQSKYLIDFARRRNLLISGGSDYHGTNKQQHELGIGRGNLNINRDIINNWNVKCYNID